MINYPMIQIVVNEIEIYIYISDKYLIYIPIFDMNYVNRLSYFLSN